MAAILENKSKTKVEMICACGEHYLAKKADIRRGWGTSCSKTCAAKKKRFDLADATFAEPKDAIEFGKKPERQAESIDPRVAEARAKREENARVAGYYPYASEAEKQAAIAAGTFEA